MVLDSDSTIESKKKQSFELRLCVKLDEAELKFEFKKKDKLEDLTDDGWFDLKELYNKKQHYLNAMIEKLKPLNNEKIKIIKDNYNKKIEKVLDKYIINILPIKVDYRTALDIFKRINTNSIALTPSEITYSLLIFGNNNMRKELNRKIKTINSNLYKFKIDFFIKLIMLIYFGDSKYDYKNLEKNIDEVNKKWNVAFKYTKKVIKLLKNNKLFDNVITSYNAIIPIVYYYYRCDGHEIRKKAVNDINKFNIIKGKKHTISDDEKKHYYII